MSKSRERLTPIPKPGKRKRPPAEVLPAGSVSGNVCCLSGIAEGIRGLAVPIGELLLDPANARTHSEKNLEAIRGSLAVYGQTKPVVVRRATNTVIAGNGTLRAALSLGWTHLAAVYVDMDAAQAAGYAIADNRTAELGDWDTEALDKLLRECSTGNDERLDQMMADLARAEKLVPGEEKTKADKPPEQEDVNFRTEGKAKCVCPQCGHAWASE